MSIIRFRSTCLVLAAVAALGGTLRAQTVFDETWAEGNRTTQNPPNSLDWYFSTTSSSSVVSGGTLVSTTSSSRELVAYFPPVTLAVGKSLTLSFTFSVAAPLHGESDTSGADNGFRWGLYYTGSAQPNANMATLDGSTTGNPDVTSTGYMAAVDLDPITGASSTETNALNLRKRFNLSNALATSTSSFTSFSTPPPTAVTPQAITAGTTYSCVMVLQQTTPTDTIVTTTITGGGLTGYTTSVDDNGSTAAPSGASAAGNYTTFDTVAFAIASTSSVPAASALTLGPIALALGTAAPPSSPPVISSATTASATVGSSFAYSIVASNSPTGYTVTGSLPTGISLNATTGVISGTPTQAGSFPVTLTATNSAGAGTASLTITVASSGGGGPPITTQPSSQTIVSGSTVVFSVAASGASSPTYQWQLNGTSIPGATSARLVVSGATSVNQGLYTCIVTGSGGSTTTTPATLSIVSTTNVGRLVNLSVNTTAGKSQVLTVGFVTGGAGTSGSQTLLIRATGPALTAFGVPNVLADPTLTVFSGQTVVTSNDNWGTPAANEVAVTTADNATGAFALNNPASLDAALVDALTAGGYTVQVSGNTAASGTTLAEVYDDTPANTYTLATPRLINISSNNLIAASGSMTAGFVIGGTTAKTVLIRATGPALALLGVQGTMPDPQLALHTTINNQDTILASNAGWGGDPQITAVDTAVGAFPLTSATSKDSVVLVTLPPGDYTAVASSVTGTAGIALIEVYEVP